MNRIAKLLPARNILLNVASTSKKRLFEQLALMFENEHGIERGKVFDSLFARERLGSTGLGQAVAIPHGRIKGLKEAMADYEAALADDPEQTASLYVGGIVADRMGDKAKAAAMLKAAKTVFPDVGHFYAHFGIKP